MPGDGWQTAGKEIPGKPGRPENKQDSPEKPGCPAEGRKCPENAPAGGGEAGNAGRGCVIRVFLVELTLWDRKTLRLTPGKDGP